VLKQGQKIFEFEIMRPLGQGGFASIYEAKDILLNRRVAIKELSLEKGADEKNLKRFVQEARATALDHPNVVTIYGLRMHEKRFYMIMEYLSGGTLRELVDTHGKLPVEDAIRLTIGICDGLAKFHAKGIIHRDIKAENILLTADHRPKVADLGIAHVPESAGGLLKTQAGFQPGTLLYSSPEQLRGEKLDPRSDVYQVGELLYYMLKGEHYINLKQLEQLAVTHGGQHQVRSQMKLFELLEKAVCDEMPVGLKTLWLEVGALAFTVESALAKDKEDRFNNTVELGAALRAFSVNTTPTDVRKANRQQALENSRAYNKRGLAHASMRNYEQAIIDYNRSIELDPNYVDPYHNRSIVYLMMDNYGQSLIDCNKTITLAPDFMPAYINRGITYTGLRHYDLAAADYTTVLELTPENFYAYYNRGNTNLWTSKYEDAIADYSQTIALQPDFVAAHVNRGVVNTQMDKFEEAIVDYTHAIELNPSYTLAYYNRAFVHRKLGNGEAAIADYTKVIELNTEHPFVYHNRADAYMAIGDSERFEEDYGRAFISAPSSIDPRKLNVARSMLMPATPLDFLTRK